MVGSGFGDPLDRDPRLVLNDVLDHAVSTKFADKIYGVMLTARTRRCRRRCRRVPGAACDRSEPPRPSRPATAGPRGPAPAATPVPRIHEYLEVVKSDAGMSITCRKCSNDFGPADGNYKEASLYRVVDKDALTELPPPGGRKSMGAYVEYCCPGCGTLLDVETHVAALEGETVQPVWDIDLLCGRHTETGGHHNGSRRCLGKRRAGPHRRDPKPVFHQVYHPGFAGGASYVVALVASEEGPRVLSNVIGIPPEAVACDTPVRVAYEGVFESMTLPEFTRPAERKRLSRRV